MENQLQKNKYTKLLLTILASGGAFFLNCVINLVLPPYITNRVGMEAYGFVTLAKNFVQYAAIVTIALNSFSSRHIAVEYHQGNLKKANVFFSSTFYGDLLLGSGLFAVLLVCIVFLERLIQIPAALELDIKLLFLMVAVHFFISTLFTAFGTAAYIKNKLDVTGMFKALSYAVEAAVLLLLFLLLPSRVYYVGIGLVAQALVVILSNVWIHRRHTPQLVIKRMYYSAAAIKRLVFDGVWASLNNLGETLNTGLDLLVCNLLLTPADMSYLAFSKTVSAIFSNLFVLIGQAFQPIFLKCYAAGDIKGLVKELRFSMNLSGMFSNIAYAGLAVLGMVFFRLWIPEQNTQLIYEVAMIENMLVISSGTMFPLYYIYFLTVKKKLPTIITIISGVLNVISMYVLIRFFGCGVHAVVWTTTVILFIVNFITNPLYMAHVLHVPLTTFFPNIVKNVFSLAVLLAVFKGLTLLYLPDSWITLALSAMALTCIGMPLHMLLTLNREDRRRIVLMVKQKLLSR